MTAVALMVEAVVKPEDLFQAIGAVLALERRKLELEQREVAELAGMSRQLVSNVENGATDKMMHYSRYSWALGLRVALIISKAEALCLEDDDLDEWKSGLDRLLAERGSDAG